MGCESQYASLLSFIQAREGTTEKLTVYYDRDVVRGQAFGNYLQGFGEVGIAAHNVKRSMRRHGAKNADYRGGVTCL